MTQSFPDSYEKIAEDMGITLYQRFSMNEASLFLRCQIDDVKKLQKNGTISFIQVTKIETMFFGYQLLEYLLENISERETTPQQNPDVTERILRIKEVTEMTGLSRTTIWRMERKSEFPVRVSLGANSVGWRASELQSWIDKKR